MTSTFIPIILAIVPSIVFGAPVKNRTQPLLSKFSSLVVFGDSYTDDGVYNYTPPVATQVPTLYLED